MIFEREIKNEKILGIHPIFKLLPSLNMLVTERLTVQYFSVRRPVDENNPVILFRRHSWKRSN